jgi:hypothetical protein
VTQRREGDQIVVTVSGAGPVAGLANVRPLRVELISAVTVTRERGWAVVEARTVHACVPDADTAQVHTFRFHISGPSPVAASVLLVCDHAFTQWGEDVYARFVTPVQTANGLLSDSSSTRR